MTADPVTYLDFASTAALRPDAVHAAVSAFLRDVGATPGRGGHRLSVAADRIALHCRSVLAQLLDIPGDPGRIVFFPNATYALNAAIRGTARKGCRIVVTTFDHNSVLRPAHAVAQEQAGTVTTVPGDARGGLDMDAFIREVDGATLVVINAVSNVLGTALDVKALTAIAHEHGAVVLVDAAQAAGEVDMSVRECDVDMVAFTGHKSLLGPPGSGGLWVKEGIDVDAVISGGTGGDGMQRAMPVAYPDHLEAGSQNGLAIAGLAAGAEWLHEQGIAAVADHARDRARRLHDGLAAIDGVRMLSPRDAAAPIVTIVHDDLAAPTLAARLDREYGVLTRAGHHCAPEVHRMLGTAQSGAVRFSTGWCTSDRDIDKALAAVAAICAGATRSMTGAH